MVELNRSQFQRINKLLRAAEAAKYSNPISLPDHPNPPTVTVATATDASLGAAFSFAQSASVLNTQLAAKVAVLGGVPLATNGYMAIAAASYLPNTSGNLAGFVNANVTGDLNQRGVFVKTITQSQKFELAAYHGPNRNFTLIVDGYQVRRNTLLAGTTAGNGDNFLQIDFGAKYPKTIEIGLTGGGNGLTASLFKHIKLDPGETMRAPDAAQRITAWCFWDSMGEGFPYTLDHPLRLAFNIMCRLLGIDDPWNFSVGSIGILADNNGTRSKLAAQITRAYTWAAAGGKKPDVIFIPMGYNDGSLVNAATATPAQIGAELLADLQLIRSYDPTVPIVVYGAETGTRNLDAVTLNVENAIAGAVATFNDPFCKFAPISTAASPYNFGTGKVGATNNSGPSDSIVGADGVHHSNPIGNFSSAVRHAEGALTCIAMMGY